MKFYGMWSRPTILICPKKTLINCGNSSKLNFLKKLPTLVLGVV
jgi:hypothetical protein